MNVNMNLTHSNLIVILVYTHLKIMSTCSALTHVLFKSWGERESIKTELLKDTEKAVKCGN